MIRDHLVPTISKNLSPAALTRLMKDIAAYVDKNSEILMNMNLSERSSFAVYDGQVV